MSKFTDILKSITTKKYSLSPTVIQVVSGGIVGGVCFYTGYRYGFSTAAEEWSRILDEELEEARRFFQASHSVTTHQSDRVLKVGESGTSQSVPDSDDEPHVVISGRKGFPTVDDAAAALLTYHGIGQDSETDDLPVEPNDEDDSSEEVVINVDIPEDDDWDYDAEVERRLSDPDAPYVISYEEWFENEYGFTQTQLTFYLDDGVLADDADEAIPFPEKIVGDALDRFGCGTDDPDVVLVRNDRLSTDFEITRTTGNYKHIVLGLEHSDGGSRSRRRENQPRKYRGDP